MNQLERTFHTAMAIPATVFSRMPENTLPIMKFLNTVVVPSPRTSTIPAYKVLFSKCDPTPNGPDPYQVLLPPTDVLLEMRKRAADQWVIGVCSLAGLHTGHRLPLWYLNFWTELHIIIKARVGFLKVDNMITYTLAAQARTDREKVILRGL
jgi:hypothetical protein